MTLRKTFSKLVPIVLALILPAALGYAQEEDNCPSGVDYQAWWSESFDEGDYQDAVQAATCWIAEDPEYDFAYAMRGRSYNALDQHAEAVADYTTAIELQGDYDYYYALRANAYNGLSEFDLALADATFAIELDPDYAYAYALRGDNYLDMEDPTAAIDDLTRAIELDSDYVWPLATRSLAYQQLNLLDEALADAEAAIAIDPEYGYGYTRRGEIYYLSGQYDLALEDFEMAGLYNFDNIFSFVYRSIIFNRLGEVDEAQFEWNKLLRFRTGGEPLMAGVRIETGGLLTVMMFEGALFEVGYEASAGQPLVIALTDIDPDAVVDPLLIVLGPNGLPLALDDDSGPVWDSRLSFTPDEDGLYTLVITHAYAGSEGLVQLTVIDDIP